MEKTTLNKLIETLIESHIEFGEPLKLIIKGMLQGQCKVGGMEWAGEEFDGDNHLPHGIELCRKKL